MKRMDQIGISLLSILLVLSFVFRVSPVSIMNPGFPILRQSLWDCLTNLAYWCRPTERITDVYDFSKVSYESLFLVSDTSQPETSFSIKHDVTRFSNSEEAMLALQTNYENYRNDNLYFRLIIDIPGLNFTSGADQYYLWCEQLMREPSVSYAGESVTTCYYWSVYGRFYSELRLGMWPNIGGGRHFSIEMFGDVLNRADNKLVFARWWLK